MRKKKLLFIMLIILNTTLFLLTARTIYAESIVIYPPQARRIIREGFDVLYPGVPDTEKRNILIILTSSLRKEKPIYTAELSYKGEEGMSVYITIDRTTGQIIDHTPWNFAALINDYLCSLNRNELDSIVKPQFQTALEETIANYPEKAKSFLDEYGKDALSIDKMYFEYVFISPNGIGYPDDSPHWQVFVAHSLDVNPLTNINYGNEWFYAEVDGITGEITESRITGYVFTVDTRLR